MPGEMPQALIEDAKGADSGHFPVLSDNTDTESSGYPADRPGGRGREAGECRSGTRDTAPDYDAETEYNGPLQESADRHIPAR